MVLIVLFSLYFGLSYGDEVRPWKDLKTSEETQETKIYCNYSLSNNAYTEYLFWYQQTPGRNPRYILHRYKASGGSKELRSEESDRGFIGHLNTSTKMTYLSISNTQLSDSALYYCALGTTVMLIKVQLLTKASVETLRITLLCAEKPWMFMLMPCLEADLYQAMKTFIPWAHFNLVNTHIALPVRWVFINPKYPRPHPSLPPHQYNNCQRGPNYPERLAVSETASQSRNKINCKL
ncbi:hypothetical protein AOXY_G25669 [Acipenser oxyrinchus oxyrinchus]|uniref:Immunoglobulin V-set domain-containing protein n=1 Tax=Acipenser oxyrinchus oxyrinchus TaxID=40147 RepID=A0AAD8CSX1_ACIOX|nr:hypothetical protein AOXY_G25669 [Acipenser oxyrinchus oxyrinchus]